MRLYELLKVLKCEFYVVNQNNFSLFETEDGKIRVSDVTDYGSCFVSKVSMVKGDDKLKITINT